MPDPVCAPEPLFGRPRARPKEHPGVHGTTHHAGPHTAHVIDAPRFRRLGRGRLTNACGRDARVLRTDPRAHVISSSCGHGRFAPTTGPAVLPKAHNSDISPALRPHDHNPSPREHGQSPLLVLQIAPSIPGPREQLHQSIASGWATRSAAAAIRNGTHGTLQEAAVVAAGHLEMRSALFNSGTHDRWGTRIRRGARPLTDERGRLVG